MRSENLKSYHYEVQVEYAIKISFGLNPIGMQVKLNSTTKFISLTI
jgi:hypothetical protein